MRSMTIMYSDLRGTINTLCRENCWTLAEAREKAPVAPRVFTALMRGEETLTIEEFGHLCEWLNISADSLLGLSVTESPLPQQVNQE